jgi:hypothetical protein
VRNRTGREIVLEPESTYEGRGMASINDVQQVTEDLEDLVGELRSELQKGADFERLTQIADEISEHADNAAQTFSSVNETLMARIGELGGKRSGNRKTAAASASKS